MEQACLVDTPSSGDVERLRRLYERNPTSTIFARLADAYLSLGEPDRAIAVCRQGLRYRPSYITGHLVLARAFSDVGDLRAAEEEFQKVLRLDPDNPASIRHLAALAERSGDAERAEAMWCRLRTLDPLNGAIPGRTVPVEEAPAPEDASLSPPPEDPVVEETPPTTTSEFPFVSLTLARLYASQGHRTRAERLVQLIDPEQAEELLDQVVQDAAQ